MKFKTFLTAHKGLVRDVVTSACLLGGSAGIVFGVSAATFHIQYMDLNDSTKRFAAWTFQNYASERIRSEFNMNKGPYQGTVPMPVQQMTEPSQWISWHPGAKDCPFNENKQKAMQLFDGSGKEIPEGDPISSSAATARKGYTSMVIDGATHVTMDRSFNQQLFEGLGDFNVNMKKTTYNITDVDSSRPSQDSPTEFMNIYKAVMKDHNVIGLAGFNHATPMNQLMTHVGESPYASCSAPDVNELAQRTAFVLLDANISDNQNIASVQFRADQPGFLTALAVCDYFYHNLHIYHDHYQDISVGAFGGIALPTVLIYMGGFERGVELFNFNLLYAMTLNVGATWWFGNPTQREELKMFEKQGKTFENLVNYSKYKEGVEAIAASSGTLTEKMNEFNASYRDQMYDEYSIKMIKLGDAANHFSGTFASGDAIGITKQFLNRGASALIVVAGPQSLDAAQEIQNQKSKCVVVGVDTAMEDGDYQRFHAGCSDKNRTDPNDNDPYVDITQAEDKSRPSTANGIIKFSAVKDIKSVSTKMSRLVAYGRNWDVSDESGEKPDPHRAICGPGFQTCGNLSNGLVSISWDGFYYLFDALQHLAYGAGEMPFASAWTASVEQYKDMIGDEEWKLIDEEYRNGIETYSNLETFNRYNEDGSYTTYYNNYIHTTCIVAKLLDFATIAVNRDLSLWPNEPGDLSRGFREMGPNEVHDVSVLDWLDYNMYFTC